ncbi:unnamed protein product [Amoebophrya sp. A25]|nr:unnamed protein product [Amoebophrya sp. A25]|eukprot:GSA25T00013017001.1
MRTTSLVVLVALATGPGAQAVHVGSGDAALKLRSALLEQRRIKTQYNGKADAAIAAAQAATKLVQQKGRKNATKQIAEAKALKADADSMLPDVEKAERAVQRLQESLIQEGDAPGETSTNTRNVVDKVRALASSKKNAVVGASSASATAASASASASAVLKKPTSSSSSVNAVAVPTTGNLKKKMTSSMNSSSTGKVDVKGALKKNKDSVAARRATGQEHTTEPTKQSKKLGSSTGAASKKVEETKTPSKKHINLADSLRADNVQGNGLPVTYTPGIINVFASRASQVAGLFTWSFSRLIGNASASGSNGSDNGEVPTAGAQILAVQDSAGTERAVEAESSHRIDISDAFRQYETQDKQTFTALKARQHALDTKALIQQYPDEYSFLAATDKPVHAQEAFATLEKIDNEIDATLNGPRGDVLGPEDYAKVRQLQDKSMADLMR